MKRITTLLLLGGIVFPAIGIIDIAEAKIFSSDSYANSEIFEPIEVPVKKVNIISPYGGEVWKKGDIETIKWWVDIIPYDSANLPKYQEVSLDLYKIIEIPIECKKVGGEIKGCLKPDVEEFNFVKHIGSVNLFKGSYDWKISKDIPDGKNYIIRISEKLSSIPFIWDESNEFTIVDEQISDPLPEPKEPEEPISNLSGVIELLKQINENLINLQRMIEKLIKIIERLPEMV